MNDESRPFQTSIGDGKEGKIGKIHDRFVASFLKNPEYAADFFSSNLDVEIAEQIDWTRLNVEATTFADDKNRLHFADMAFSAPFKNEESSATFFLLLEHKSNVEKTLPLQLLKYVVLQADSFVERPEMEVGGRWPCPIAFVLHNGPKPWRKKPKPRDVLYSAKNCDRFVPDFDYAVLDLASTSVEKLKGGTFVRVFLELLKRATDGTFKEALKGLLLLVDAGYFGWDAATKATVKSFWRYIADVAKNKGAKITPAEIQKTIDELKNERNDETMKSFIEEFEEIGLKKGLERGFERGETRELAKRAIRCLRKRFGAAVSQELARRVEALDDYQTLDALFDRAFDAADVAEFERFFDELVK